MSEGKDHSEDYIILRKATEATGPSVGEAGAIDELEAFPDGWEEPKPFVRSPDLITIELSRHLGRLVLKELEGCDPATNVGIFRAYLRTALKGNP